MKSSRRMGTSTRARTASRSAREPPKRRRSVRTLIAEPPPSRVLLHQRSRGANIGEIALARALALRLGDDGHTRRLERRQGVDCRRHACRTRTQLRQRYLGFALFKVLTSRGELRSHFAALRVRPAGKAVERPTQTWPGPGPLRRPLLARLAPPRHPRDRRPRLPHRTTPGPKGPRAGLPLYEILDTLQNTLPTLYGR